jgi:hypothetical protein
MALKHNRRFAGIDLEKQYFDDLAVPRIKDIILKLKENENV